MRLVLFAMALVFSAPVGAVTIQLTANDLSPAGNGLVRYSPQSIYDQHLMFSWGNSPLVSGSLTYDALIYRDVWGIQSDGTFRLYPEDGFISGRQCPLVAGSKCSVQQDSYFGIDLPNVIDISIGNNSVSIIQRAGRLFGTCDIATASVGEVCRYGVLSLGVTPQFIFENSPSVKIIETRLAVPEPSTWVFMLGGFGLVGGAMRKRVQQSLCAA